MGKETAEEIMNAYEGIVRKDPAVGARMSPAEFRRLYERTFSEKMSTLTVIDIATRLPSWFSGWSRRWADPFKKLNDAIKAEAGADALKYLGMSRDQEDSARWAVRFGLRPDRILSPDDIRRYAVNERLLRYSESLMKKLPPADARRLRASMNRFFDTDKCRTAPPFRFLTDDDLAVLERMSMHVDGYNSREVAGILYMADSYDKVRSKLSVLPELEPDPIKAISAMASEMRAVHARRTRRQTDIQVSRRLDITELNNITERMFPQDGSPAMDVRTSVRMEVDREISDNVLDTALLEGKLSPHDVEALVNAGVRNLTQERFDDIYRQYGPQSRYTQRDFLGALLRNDLPAKKCETDKGVHPAGTSTVADDKKKKQRFIANGLGPHTKTL